MKRITFLPLDERPCNFRFPSMMSEENPDFILLTPDKKILGDKKRPADFNEVKKYLLLNAAESDYAVISADMLLYGGIVPSRLHNLCKSELTERLNVIDEMKKINPALKIYAFSLIMRCPQYSSDDEEPTYYGEVGKEIFRLGEALDKKEKNKSDNGNDDLILNLREKTAYCIEDFLSRRRANLAMNERIIDLVGSVIDFLIIPQDDSSVYGFTAKDQNEVRKYIKATGKELKVYMYPGADEVGMTLLSRAVNDINGKRPLVGIEYSSVTGATVVPLYEDRIVGETVKYQITAAGCVCCADPFRADINLLLNTPSSGMVSADKINDLRREYDIERNIIEFSEKAEYYVSIGKNVVIADIAYVNGGDTELIKLLSGKNILFKLGGYAGWNTSSNTLGTAIAEGVFYNYYGNTIAHKKFISLRYFEDAGYCSFVRQYMCGNVLPELKLNYFDSGDKRGKVSERVKEEIVKYISIIAPEVNSAAEISDAYMPWKRMFEVGLEVELK